MRYLRALRDVFRGIALIGFGVVGVLWGGYLIQSGGFLSGAWVIFATAFIIGAQPE